MRTVVTCVGRRTDWKIQEWARSLRHETSHFHSQFAPPEALGTGGPTHIPLEAFYVVQTTAGIVGASLQTSQENETSLS